MRRSLLIFAFILGAICLTPSKAEATNFYVSSSGTDSGMCTMGSPCATVQFAVNLMSCGDTVIMAGGTYDGGVGANQRCASYGSGLNLTNAVGEHVTLTNSGQESIFGFASTVYPTREDIYFNFYADQPWNITLDAENGDPERAGCATGLSVDHVKLVNIECKNSKRSGITPHGRYWEFINVNSHHNSTFIPETGQRAHGIYLTDGNCTIDGGRYWDNAAYGIQIYDAGSSTNSNNVIKNVLVYDNDLGPGADPLTGNGGGGIVISHGTGNIIENAILWHNGQNSIDIYYDCINCRVYNSSITDGSNGIVVGQLAPGNASGFVGKNNIIYANAGTAIIDYSTDGTFANNLTTNPFWTSPSTHDYTLTASSTGAIEQGADLSGTFTKDFAGIDRTVPWDIGPYEYSAATCTPAKVLFGTQPSNATIGGTLGTVTAGIYDSGDVLCTSATNTVTFAKAGGATWNSLQVTSGSLVKTPVSGIATINTMFVSPTTGSGSITATGSGGLTVATSDSITISAASHSCPGNTFYIDYASGDDSYSGCDTTHAWKRAPGMTGAGSNPEYFDVDAMDLSGYRMIFKGGVSWLDDVLPWTLRGKGTGTGANAYYIGVDVSWYTGSSWSRPILNYGGSGGSFVCTNWFFGTSPGVLANPDPYRIFDNFEFTNLYWDATCNDDSPQYLAVNNGVGAEWKNLYFHGWAFDYVGMGGIGDCRYTARNCDFFYPVYGDGGSGSSFHDSVFDGSDVDNTHGHSGIGIRGTAAAHVYRNVFKHMTDGMSTIQSIVSFHDNWCDHIGVSMSTQHDQCFQDNGSGNDSFIYNNLLTNSEAGQCFYIGPFAGYTAYFFNNVVASNVACGSGVVALASTGHNTPVGSMMVWNNTIADDGFGAAGPSGGSCPTCPGGMGQTFEGLYYQNNHIISDTFDNWATCDGQMNCHRDHNIFQSFAAADTDGYDDTTNPLFVPTASGGDTIAAGTSLASNCSINIYLAALCTTSTYGVSYNTTTHTITGAGDPSASVRNATPDDGAYQFNAAAPLIVSITPDHGAPNANYDILITGLNTSWTVDSEPSMSGAGVEVAYWTWYDSAHILATFSFIAGLPSDYRDITVTTGMEMLTLDDAFHLIAPAVVMSGGATHLRLSPRR